MSLLLTYNVTLKVRKSPVPSLADPWLVVFKKSVLHMTLGILLSPAAGQIGLEFSQDKCHALTLSSLLG